MNETEFNLLDEPWVRVIDNECKVSEVSLTEVLLNAHKFKALSGELPTQDVAVMRLLLAILHTIYSRVDENGAEEPLDDDDVDKALQRWKALWDKGSFSEKAIAEYLNKWHERFWLFHPERPFGQSARLALGTEYDAPKLNGEVSESSNKIRFFSMYSGNEKKSLTYSQAARWLLYLNAYDDTSSKPTKEGKSKAGGKLPSPGIGWLGKLGLIYLTGNNLFETLMLNLIMINSDSVQSDQLPLWEKDHISSEERTEISIPNNLAELYTFQSRRIMLNRKECKVVSYRLLGGDFFQKENAFFEPMTVWQSPKNGNDAYTPRRHDSSKQMWREFSVLFGGSKSPVKTAGIIDWFIRRLQGKLIPRSYYLKTTITAVEYGDKDFFVKNVFSDSLTMHAEILSELGADWRDTIELEISNCSKLAETIARLAQDLYVASGGKIKKDKHYAEIPGDIKSQLYFRLDIPFREWLRSIDPECEDERIKFEKQQEWQLTAKNIAVIYAKEMVSEAPEKAVIGHKTEDSLYSVPKAMISFRSNLNKIYSNE